MSHRHDRSDGRDLGPCLVWGGYGWGNTGDDLTLAVALRDLRARPGRARQLLTQDPDHSGLAQPGLPCVPVPWDWPARGLGRWLWQLADRAAAADSTEVWSRRCYRLALRYSRRVAGAAWHEAFASASALHLVGGGYLTDVFDLRYMLRPIRLARVRGLPVTTSPLGLGPFADPAAAAAVARALRGARVLVRDAASLDFCRRHGVTAEERPDDGFRLDEVIDGAAGSAWSRESPRLIGVCIFPQFSAQWSLSCEPWWVEALRALVRAFPQQPVRGFCFHTDRRLDFESTRRLFAAAGLDPAAVAPPEPDFRAAIGSLRRFGAIVSTRFHAAVAASVLGIPCVAVAQSDYYEIKMDSAMRPARTPVPVLNPSKSEPSRLAVQLQQMLGGSVAA
jgi:polysaccharide pyruvyl transferase WcaK-like protein